MNLLKADLFHLKKDKLFYILLAVTFVLPLFSCLMPVVFGTATANIENIIFQSLGTDILCVLIGIEISSFIGKDFANNTIRNKICYGEKRTKIVLMYFIETLFIALSFILISLVSSLLFGVMFAKITFSADFIAKLLCQILILLSFAFVITGIVVCSKNIKAGFIFTILISVLLNAVSYIMPMLASTNQIANFLCRVLYMIVSSMLISSTGGTYTYGASTFGGIYLNSVLIFVVYTAVSLIISLIITKKHEYK